MASKLLVYTTLQVCEKNLDELLCSTCGCHVFQHCLRRLILLLNTSGLYLKI